jgi:hypothetical protein
MPAKNSKNRNSVIHLAKTYKLDSAKKVHAYQNCTKLVQIVIVFAKLDFAL